MHRLLIDTWLVARHPEATDAQLAEAGDAIETETRYWPVTVPLLPHLEALYAAFQAGKDLSEARPTWPSY